MHDRFFHCPRGIGGDAFTDLTRVLVRVMGVRVDRGASGLM